VIPWQTIDRVATREGPLELRRRGERDFLITIAGRVLMTSAAHRSEDALARLGCAPLQGAARPRVLLGGLGMGYTLRAALDELPRDATVEVVELNPRVVDWCRGPLAALTAAALDDRRVQVRVGDVARAIADAPAGRYHAILLDLYQGPRARADDQLYGADALQRTRAALRSGGVAAVWSEEPDRSFEARLGAAGFRVQRHREAAHGGRKHVVYVAERLPR